jgi:RNA polymerase sigma-B factor
VYARFRDKRWQLHVVRPVKELVMQARTATWQLSPREQKILLMRFYDGMTQDQIGRQLGISQMQVSRLLSHALGYLRPRLLGLDEATAR